MQNCGIRQKNAHFNSIKVRLELSEPPISTHPFRFQFHKGTIRTDSWQLPLWARIYFNSIKVRLEPLLVDIPADILLFQFHKGTIRTSTRQPLRLLDVSFQFHKGTIRTSSTSFPFPHSLYFNSIKVRLELCSIY